MKEGASFVRTENGYDVYGLFALSLGNIRITGERYRRVGKIFWSPENEEWILNTSEKFSAGKKFFEDVTEKLEGLNTNAQEEDLTQ